MTHNNNKDDNVSLEEILEIKEHSSQIMFDLSYSINSGSMFTIAPFLYIIPWAVYKYCLFCEWLYKTEE